MSSLIAIQSTIETAHCLGTSSLYTCTFSLSATQVAHWYNVSVCMLGVGHRRKYVHVHIATVLAPQSQGLVSRGYYMQYSESMSTVLRG